MGTHQTSEALGRCEQKSRNVCVARRFDGSRSRWHKQSLTITATVQLWPLVDKPNHWLGSVYRVIKSLIGRVVERKRSPPSTTLPRPFRFRPESDKRQQKSKVNIVHLVRVFRVHFNGCAASILANGQFRQKHFKTMNIFGFH